MTLALALGCAALLSISCSAEPEDGQATGQATASGEPSSTAGSASATTGAVVYGPESLRVLSISGRAPVTLRLVGPGEATFRIRMASGAVKPCTVTRSRGGLAAPVGMPANATSHYTVECQATGVRHAFLLTTVPTDSFDYEFEVALGAA